MFAQREDPAAADHSDCEIEWVRHDEVSGLHGLSWCTMGRTMYAITAFAGARAS